MSATEWRAPSNERTWRSALRQELRLRWRHRIAVLPQQVLHPLDAVAIAAVVAIEPRRLARHVRPARAFALAGGALVPVGEELGTACLGFHLGRLGVHHGWHANHHDACQGNGANTMHGQLL